MKYRLHENGWTVIVEDIELNNACQDDINQIARLLASNTLVICKRQHLTIEDEVRIAKMFKEPQTFDVNTDKWEAYKGCEVPEAEQLMFRVTGEKDEHGRPGLAPSEDELHWHANDATTPDRKSIVWLYGVKGTAGSRTTFSNNILSYNNLEIEKRNKLENLYWIPFGDTSDYDSIFTSDDSNVVAENYEQKLVITNIAGKKGFYFPFLQIAGFKGLTKEESKELISWLSEYTTQEQFCYHHDWEDGDLVISEQWLGLHKRWPFKQIEKRLLHRMAFDFPDQDYTI